MSEKVSAKDSLKVDFVVTWVDGKDEEWIKQFNSFLPDDRKQLDVSSERYRDAGLLKYWFRAVEKYAPWVNKVHFVTCGQKPEWLDESCEKLNLVNHKDFIPNECLPVFSANPIEVNLHRIPDLAEHFVFFNDDFFLTQPVKPQDFFKHGKACDLSSLGNLETSSNFGHLVLNDLIEINNHFSKNSCIKKNFFKWFNLKNGSGIIQTVCLMPWRTFKGFYEPHTSYPYTKTLFEKVWSECSEKLNETNHSRYRSTNDVNQWLFRYWRLCEGNFTPSSFYKKCHYFNITDNIDVICRSISKGKYKEVILNDASCDDWEQRVSKIRDAFEALLPEKSSFEK